MQRLTVPIYRGCEKPKADQPPAGKVEKLSHSRFTSIAKTLTLGVMVALWAAVVATVVLRDLPTPAYMVDKTTKEVRVVHDSVQPRGQSRQTAP